MDSLKHIPIKWKHFQIGACYLGQISQWQFIFHLRIIHMLCTLKWKTFRVNSFDDLTECTLTIRIVWTHLPEWTIVHSWRRHAHCLLMWCHIGNSSLQPIPFFGLVERLLVFPELAGYHFIFTWSVLFF